MHHTLRSRPIGLATIGLTVAIVISACSSGATATKTSADKSPINLSFAAWEFLEPGKGDAIWDTMKNYHGPNGNVTLVRTSEPYKTYADKMATQIGAKGGPDVMVLQDSQFFTFAAAKLLVPMNDIAKEYKGQLNDGNTLGFFQKNQYGFHWEQSDYGLLYNKDVLAKAGVKVPTTYPELVAAAEKIHSDLGIYGYANRSNVSELDGWTLEMNNWISGFGGSLSKNGKLTIDSTNNVAAVDAFAKLFRSPAVPKGENSSTLRAQFAQNQIGFVMENAGVASTLTQDPKNLINGMNLGVAPLPFSYPGGNTTIMLAVNANSKHQGAAEDFVRFILSEKEQAALRGALTDTTLAREVPLRSEFVTANPFATEFIKIGKTSKDSVVPGFETHSRQIWSEVLNAVQGLVINGGDAKSALSTVQKSVVGEFE